MGVGGNSFLTLMKEVRNKGIGVGFLKEDLGGAALAQVREPCFFRHSCVPGEVLFWTKAGEGTGCDVTVLELVGWKSWLWS